MKIKSQINTLCLVCLFATFMLTNWQITLALWAYMWVCWFGYLLWMIVYRQEAVKVMCEEEMNELKKKLDE